MDGTTPNGFINILTIPLNYICSSIVLHLINQTVNILFLLMCENSHFSRFVLFYRLRRIPTIDMLGCEETDKNFLEGIQNLTTCVFWKALAELARAVS